MPIYIPGDPRNFHRSEIKMHNLNTMLMHVMRDSGWKHRARSHAKVHLDEILKIGKHPEKNWKPISSNCMCKVCGKMIL